MKKNIAKNAYYPHEEDQKQGYWRPPSHSQGKFGIVQEKFDHVIEQTLFF